jgi:YbgC/YbaW family acyl-CoA thioester hydrolase
MFTSQYKIAFSETDPGGILFFAEFLKIAHITYERFFESLKLSRNYFLDEEYVLPIVHTEADYLAPVKFGDTLNCQVKVGNIGKTSFELLYNLKLGDKIAARVVTKHVVVLKKGFQKTEVTDDLLFALRENQS